jgi:hypothetical protein
VTILPDNYLNGKVIREYKNIDILLKSNNERNAIIVENKSNNAIDQKNQLYRYYKMLEEEEIRVDAIVYLNKNALKNPSLSDKELIEINDILIKAQLVGIKNSFEEVLDSVIQTTDNIRLNALSCEIRDLFVAELLQNNNFTNLQSSIKAYNQLPVYFTHKYKSYIGSKNINFDLGYWKPYYLCLNAKTKDFTLAVDFSFSLSRLEILVFIRRGDKKHLEKYKEMCGDEFPFIDKRNDNLYKIIIENVFDEKTIQDKIDLIINTVEKYIRQGHGT